VGQAKKPATWWKEFSKWSPSAGRCTTANSKCSEGFSVYNDVAFAGKYLLENTASRISFWMPTHAGNGTAEYFYEDPEFSSWTSPGPSHPVSGTGFINQIRGKEGKEYNLPMPPYAEMTATGWLSGSHPAGCF
jgi:acetoin utilization deacetylase AcuC-like enzyme